MKRISLILVLSIAALSLGACKHRNKKHSCAPQAYPTAAPVYGYSK